MKRTTKILSFILAVTMLFTMIPFSASAEKVIPESTTTIDKLISNDSLGDMIQRLLKDINASKKNIIGTVLKLVFMFVKDESLQNLIGEQDVSAMTDEQKAKILMDWVDYNLKNRVWFDMDPIEVLGIKLNLTSVDELFATLCNILNKDAILSLAGDLKDFNASAVTKEAGSLLKDATPYSRADGDLTLVYQLFQFLDDNSNFFKKFLVGGVNAGTGSSGINLGTLVSTVDGIIDGKLSAALEDANKIPTNLKPFLKAQLYRLVNGYADTPDLMEDPTAANGEGTGINAGLGKSVYADYTADELLAVAFLKLVGKMDTEDIITSAGQISKADADAALKKNFYTLLGENCDKLFDNYGALEWLNKNVNSLVDALCITDEIRALFNTDITFVRSDFDEIFAGAKTDGVLAQINNIAKLALTKALKNPASIEFTDSLNENIEALVKFVLPYMADAAEQGKFDEKFKKYTAEYIEDKGLTDIAVDVLKLFYGDWFEGSEATVNKATTLAQLGAGAVYYAIAGKVELTGVDKQMEAAEAKLAKIDTLSDEECKTFMLDTAAALVLGAMNNNGDKFGFSAPAKATDGYTEMLGYIADWALNFAKGLPAVVNKVDMSSGDVFYKLNVILNELIDFSFITGAESKTFDNGIFQLDVEVALNTLIDDICTLDFDDLLGMFEINDNAGNILGGSYTVISGVLSFLNRAFTALFEHNCTAVKKDIVTGKCLNTVVTTYTCCACNGHALSTEPEVKTNTVTTHQYNVMTYVATDARNKNVSCTVDGAKVYACDCGAETKVEVVKCLGHNFQVSESESTPATCQSVAITVERCTRCNLSKKTEGKTKGSHSYTVVETVEATCVSGGYKLLQCSVCGKQTEGSKVAATGIHTYVNGTCSVCGATDPNAVKAYTPGDIDNDKQITAADARLALRASVGLEKFDDVQNKAGDVDGDKQVTAADARLILRASVGLEDASQW